MCCHASAQGIPMAGLSTFRPDKCAVRATRAFALHATWQYCMGGYEAVCPGEPQPPPLRAITCRFRLYIVREAGVACRELIRTLAVMAQHDGPPAFLDFGHAYGGIERATPLACPCAPCLHTCSVLLSACTLHSCGELCSQKQTPPIYTPASPYSSYQITLQAPLGQDCTSCRAVPRVSAL